MKVFMLYTGGGPLVIMTSHRQVEDPVLLGKLTSLDVLAQDGARAAYGDGLDRAVVRCAGEATSTSASLA